MDHKYLSYEGLKRFFYTKILKQINSKIDKTNGDISNTKVRSLETMETKFPIPTAGETIKRFLGKVTTFLINIKPLESNVNYYVSTAGNDTIGNGTSTRPYKTIKYALDTIPKDLGSYTATIYLADGTYDETVNVIGYRSGVIDIKSQNSPEALNTLCRVKKIVINHCYARVQLYGLYITQTDDVALDVASSSMIHVRCCQAVESAPSSYAFNFTYAKARLSGCKCTNHSTCVRAYLSEISSENWASSSANEYGITSNTGGRISKVGSQPTGTISNEYITNGGQIIETNGTQITNIIKTGLSCTWGTIGGGYNKHGNSNAAMVTIQTKITLSSELTANTDYVINGFPYAALDTACTCSNQSNTINCYIDTAGQLKYKPLNGNISGAVISFNCTYLTIA